MKNNRFSRRRFVRQLAIGSAAAGSAPQLLARDFNEHFLTRNSVFTANDNIQIALIGAGGMGSEDTKTALKVPGVKIIATCDLYDGRLENAKKRWGSDIVLTRDYKEILAMKDVDAVIVGTPDHWHKQISIDAMKSGKSVYCEKPMVHSINEGAEVLAAQEQTGKIFQVGSQGMSSLGNEKAKELYEAGAIGELNYAEGFWARNSPGGAWQYAIPKDASAKTVDWKKYISNTKTREFDPLRFFRWRNYRDYGTGVAGDLFVHLFSSLHYITSSKGPNKIMSTGGLRYWKDGREVPDILLGMFDYPQSEAHPAFNLSLRVNFVDGTSGSTYLRLVGNEGAMDVKWGEVVLRKNISSGATDDPFLSAKAGEQVSNYDRKQMLPPAEAIFKAEDGYKGAHYDHFHNWFEGIRTNTKVTEDALFGYRAAAPALACNNSYFGEQIIKWDPENLKVL